MANLAEDWTDRQIPDQQGRVAVVTGANTGLGFEVARVLATRRASVLLAVRDVEKGKRAAERISAATGGTDLGIVHLDLASLESVRDAAAAMQAAHPSIDLLINNAGVMFPAHRMATRNGFELQMGTNHLGHFALTGLLLDRLLSVPGSRVVTVSSPGHRIRARINFDDLQWERGYDRMAAYGQSKLANLLFTYELQRRLTAGGATTIAVAAHPGLASTDLFRHSPAALRLVVPAIDRFLAQTPGQGALPILRAATDPGVLGGQYYGPGAPGQIRGNPRPVTSSPRSYDLATQERLWSVSEDLTGVTFPV